MRVFIDIEVSPQSQKVTDYGAVRDDGAVLHTHSEAEFLAMVEPCDEVCGHNIVAFDLGYLHLKAPHRYIDTLPLSPLLFPKRPYHHLVKDDKLQSEELNNPVNDARKARELLDDELAEWHRLSPRRQAIYYGLLADLDAFRGFFATVGRPNYGGPIDDMVRDEYAGRICPNAKIKAVAQKYPAELAYALAVTGTGDLQSLTPPWVLHQYPRVDNVLHYLLATPCGDPGCPYCSRHLDTHAGLHDFFGYDEFRRFDGVPMQQQAVEAALRGESLLTIFPTGGGKSLTFQLPALMTGRNMHGLTVVISPLQSLMKDQVDNLAERGISEAVAINGLLDPIERAAAIAQVAEGSANLLYISPEMLRSRTIERLLTSRTVVRFVIDEAHCFSAWGQDFRVDYLYIADFIAHLQQRRRQQTPIAVSCFTATAKPKVVSDICAYFRERLGLELKVFAASADRSNLHYTVIHADTPDEKYAHLRNLILGHRCPTIVYVARTRRTRELADHLRADGMAALPFNGKMDPRDKVANQDAFMRGEAQVIVATSAFGMGVDKRDVGLVVHYDISDSLENYIQEAGRAGRDPSMQADCYVLFSDNDLDKHFILLNQTKLSISEIQQVWKAIKDLTTKRDTVSCSPLDIARQAGWGDEVIDVETRVRAAIAALEQAGFIERGKNTPRVFATGITAGNMDEARQRIMASPLFDDTTREQAANIIRSLISRRAQGEGGENRVDYLSDLLGISREAVIRNIGLMRQEGLLADSLDMQAWVSREAVRRLDHMLDLESMLLKHLSEQTVTLNYKLLNEEARQAGIRHASVRNLRLLVRFLALKGYIRKEEHSLSDTVTLQLQASPEATRQRFAQRATICRFVASTLSSLAAKDGLASFSEVGLLNQYVSQQQLNFEQSGTGHSTSLADFDEAILYLSKTEIVRVEGGFLVIYNTMELHRTAERRLRYGKSHYRMLDEFYRQRIQQIHIVGEYANLMVSNYDAALAFVRDYFTLDYSQFISHYFRGERRVEIQKNITPAKYRQLFGTLSPRQREIIDDSESRLIVVAAGPGSGKTRVLVHKLASLMLLEDVKHEQLLMLTFSRAAATEFKRRLIELVGNAAHYVDIKTFHSFSFDLVGQQGSLEEADKVVERAAAMIERGEVEEGKVAKSVLVIDEAQDMSAIEFRLVRALMARNEEMRLIAVGDDDQNIYRFRGSNSAYLASLVTDQGATLYEMTANYRSDRAIVAYANQYVQQLATRMKHAPIEAAGEAEGTVVEADDLASAPLPQGAGSTAYLTATNEQALRLAHHLRQQGLHVRLVQGTDSFRFINLAEVRYFFKQLGPADTASIDRDCWETAKRRTCDTYATSSCLPAVCRFFEEYEATHRSFYRSDLREFVLESNIEDFMPDETGSVFVSTIHKAKGREFDTVHLLPEGLRDSDDDTRRAVYVGITRARHSLYLYRRLGLPDSTITLPLTMHDVWLSWFADHKADVLRLRSGDPLVGRGALLCTQDGTYVCHLAQSMSEKLKQLAQRGYSVSEATVSYVIAWRPRDEQTELAVCLANLTLVKS